MGNENSKGASGSGDGSHASPLDGMPALDHARTQVARIKAIVGGKGERKQQPPKGRQPDAQDHDLIMVCHSRISM
jgi:hypothetical protein